MELNLKICIAHKLISWQDDQNINAIYTVWDTLQIELEFGNVGFWGEGKTGVPGEKTHRARTKNQQQTQPTYDAESGGGRG